MAKEPANRLPEEDQTSDRARRWFTTRQVVALTGLCARKPVPCLACAFAVAAAALFFAYCYLDTQRSIFRLDLNPGSVAATLRDEFFAEVVNPVEAYVVVEQRDSETTPKDVKETLDAVYAELLARPELFSVVGNGFDSDSFKTNRLYFYSADEYAEALELAKTARALERGDWSQFAADAMADELRERTLSDLAEDRRSHDVSADVLAYARSLAAHVGPETTSSEEVPSPVVSGVEASVPKKLQPDPYYIFQSETSLGGGVMFELAENLDADDYQKAVTAVEGIVNRVRQAHPKTIVEASGQPFTERREYDSFERASLASLVFLVASVFVFFWAFFGAISRPLVVLASLFVGMSWTIGVQTLVFRSTSPDSVHEWFVTLCVGIAVSAVYLSEYTKRRQTNRSASEALMETASGAGASIAAFAAVAAIASIAFAFTNVATRVFCFMCGSGVALTTLATLVVTPSALKLVDGARPFRSVEASSTLVIDRELTNPYLRAFAIVGLVVVAVICLGIGKVKIDPTLASFHGLRFENIRTHERASQYLESRSLYGAIFADSVADAQEIAARLNETQSEDPSFYVDNVADRIPTPGLEDVLRVEAIGDSLRSLRPEIGPLPIPTREELVAAVESLRDAAQGAFVSRTENFEIEENLNRALEELETLSDQEYLKRVDSFERLAALETLKRLYMLRDASDSTAPSVDDLSDALKTRYLGAATGRVVLRVYSFRSTANATNLLNFVRDLREVDPNATGPAVITYEKGAQLSRWISWYFATIVLAVAISVYIRFQNLRGAFGVVFAPGFATLVLLGAAGLLNISLNPINWLALAVGIFLALCFGQRFAEDYENSPDRFFLSEQALAVGVACATVAGLFTFGLVCQETGWQNLARLGILTAAVAAGSALVLTPALLNWSAIQPIEEVLVGSDENCAKHDP